MSAFACFCNYAQFRNEARSTVANYARSNDLAEENGDFGGWITAGRVVQIRAEILNALISMYDP